MPSSPRRGSRCLAAGLLILALGACRSSEESPREGSGADGSDTKKTLVDLERMLGGGEPVVGTHAEGEAPLEGGEPYELASPDTPVPEGPALLEQLQEDPYIQFGERIIVRHQDDGTTFITKPYTMPAGKAEKLVNLIGALDPFSFQPRVHPAPGEADVPLDPLVVGYEILPNWDEELYNDLTPSQPGEGPPRTPTAATPVVLSDVIVVTATYPLLAQFEDFLDIFAAAGVPQIELEAKIIEVVESDTLDYGQRTSFDFGAGNFIQGIDFTLPNIASGTEAILELGSVTDSLIFDAVLEAIRTWDNVQIDSRPKTVVRAGGVAYIESTTEIPYFEIKTLTTAGDFTTSTVYKKVGVQLYISPRVIGTKMLALDVHLIGSQQVGTQVTFSVQDGPAIEVPVIAYRTAKTVVYLEPGQTLVIGGLTSQRDRELVNKVPILGDIPLLGLLFRSHFTRAEKQHVLFAISPRILQHSDFETEF